MILAIGDSLGVGSDPYLRASYAHVRTDSRVGRTAAQGLQRLKRHGHADVIVFALGTNDSDVVSYRRILRLTHHKRRHACLVLVSIYGTPAAKRLNGVQRSFRRSSAPGVARVAPWASNARRHPRWMASDGVHCTTLGYKQRAKLIARTISRC